MAGIGMRKLSAGLLACGLMIGAMAQQPPTVNETLQKAEQLKKVAESVAEAEVAEAIKTAYGLAKTFPDKAVRNLSDAAVKLDISANIGSTKRQELAEKLKSATAVIQKGGKPATTEIDPKVLARIEKNKKETDSAAAEAKDVQASINEIARDIDSRKDRDARSKIAALTAKYPNNGAVVQLQSQNANADSIAAARDIAYRSAEGFRVAMNSAEESAIPVNRDMTFPADWNEKMERRRKLNEPKLTAEERKLIASLDTLIPRGMKDVPFEEAVQLISTAIDQKVYLDKKSLDDLGLNLGQKVDVPGGVSGRSALRVMLQSQNLTFLVRDNIIQVVSLERAKEMMVQRAYDVRDLVAMGGTFNGPLQWGSILDAQQTYENARILVDAIQRSIDPKVWKDSAGGPATIVFHYPTMSIIVRAPSEVHADLFDKMYKGKK